MYAYEHKLSKKYFLMYTYGHTLKRLFDTKKALVDDVEVTFEKTMLIRNTCQQH